MKCATCGDEIVLLGYDLSPDPSHKGNAAVYSHILEHGAADADHLPEPAAEGRAS